MAGRILIVDDDPDIARFIEVHVLAHGLEVVGIEENGDDALRRIVAEPPDLVVMGVVMPELSGISVLEALRELNLDVPVLILSANADRYREEALALGAVGVMAKPFDPDHLMAKIDEVLSDSPSGS